MTQFHSDEYVEFLNKINPVNMGNFMKEQLKCKALISSGRRLTFYHALR